MLFEEQEKVRALLREAVTVLCRNRLTFGSQMTVEGLLGITLDNQNVFLVNINETIKAELNHEVLITSPSPITNSDAQQPRSHNRRKSCIKPRKRPREPEPRPAEEEDVSAESEKDVGFTKCARSDDEHERDSNMNDTHASSPALAVDNSTNENHSGRLSSQPVKSEDSDDVQSTGSNKERFFDASHSNSTIDEDDSPDYTPSPGRRLPHPRKNWHTGANNWWCEICCKQLSSQCRFKDHMRVHEGKFYTCEICAKRMGTAQSLTYHMNEHTGNYKYRCELCDRGFNKPHELKNHLGRAHPEAFS